MSSQKPLAKTDAYKGFTLACEFEGQEIAIVGSTVPHVKKVFLALFPKGDFDRSMVVSAVVTPAKISISKK